MTRMKAAIVTAAALALAALSVLAGCGGREPGKAPSLEDVINNTTEGS
jgi:predicted small lipoprotein YifL